MHRTALAYYTKECFYQSVILMIALHSENPQGHLEQEKKTNKVNFIPPPQNDIERRPFYSNMLPFAATAKDEWHLNVLFPPD